ncbi:glyoxylase I family protein [Hydrogenispora ethanolica]|uniref:Glyoxylase I family protein n=2 Tax=Hydrogenispora ethanolica TaxID=1082276 RepID=A0A4R1R9N3_HYDET|nr:glyoxylase I family protein [Hydrogenispora ethanolica]
MAEMILGVEHFGLMSRDPEKLAAWYRKILNFKVIQHNQKSPPTIFVAGESGSLLEIMPYTDDAIVLSGKEKRAIHTAVTVDDLERAITELKDKGVEFIGEMKDHPGGVRLIYFRDPDCNWLQLIERPQPLR